ncbi:hypothetical protein [Maribacter sp. UBA4516]|uniref:hypothetical protein n=1 Tax=Maribacter sp. UBA4516 TaxID=1946804 RepID=UPI00257FBC36|nr:hypothetical protein [Maribacter sp. UBA4516]|tara:strand:+ start:293 stop:841 length:549 start_codon:yes stop_codon:yes gene_type:complete
METSILESKLKRNKIHFLKDGNSIVIGKQKIDYLMLIGLGIFPIVSGTGILIFMFSNDILSEGGGTGKIIALSIGLMSTGLFTLSRLKNKKLNNSNHKTLSNSMLVVKNEFGEYRLTHSTIKDYQISIQQVSEDIFEGNLAIVDNENRVHQVIGMEDEKEQYVLDDLKWFSNFIAETLNVEK